MADRRHRPLVAVWTPQQTAEFLHRIEGHRLYALFHLIALRGLRRGEACGLHRSDLDLAHGTATISRQTRQIHGRITSSPPKTAAGNRSIALDHTTVAALRRHQHQQRYERAAAGERWHNDHGHVFTTPYGKPLSPDRATRIFRRLVTDTGLPPVTIHGLRHTAATLAFTAGADLKTVQDQLGHTTITLTADTYTNVLPTRAHTAAENTARLLNTARRHDPTGSNAHRPRRSRLSGGGE